MECNIPTDEILKDIKDTEDEIQILKREIKGLELVGDKMSIFRAGAKRYGIQEREEFILKLKNILDKRK